MQRRSLLSATAIAACLLGASRPVSADPLAPTGRWTLVATGRAKTPPMGWASWNAFGTDISETRILASAKAMVEDGLAAVGYRYVNVDDGWWLRRRADDGRLQVRTTVFPSAAKRGREGTSLRPFTDTIHGLGLQAGIYSDIGRNACSQAYADGTPNLPEGTQAEREVGLLGHARQDVTLFFSDWNFDYVKVDGCGLSAFAGTQSRVMSGRYRAFAPLVVDTSFNRTNIPATRALYAEVQTALKAVRPAGDYVYSICLWGAANVRSWGGEDVGTMWRTSNDIDPTWGRMLHNYDSVATRDLYAGPGRLNDPDMLEIGNGFFDAQHLTQARAHMSLWAIMAAPLIIGTDLTKVDPTILDVLRAPEVIAVDQDSGGNQGVRAYNDDEREIVVKILADGRRAVALVNRTAMPTAVTLTSEHLKLRADTPIALRDLWARRDLAPLKPGQSFALAPFETRLLSASGSPLLPHGHYLSQEPSRIHVAADGLAALEADPMIHRMIDPYNPGTTSDGNRPIYAGWGAPRADSTPYGETIRLGNVAYRYGLGILANSRLEVTIKNGVHKFSARVGVDDSTRGKTARTVFEVWGDGRRLAASRPTRFGEQSQFLTADITGITVAELVARQLEPDTTGNVVVGRADAQFD